MEAQNKPLGLPEITVGQYLMTVLFNAGLSEQSAMGDEIGLTWQSVYAFAQGTEAITEPWEVQALHDMSAAYVAAKREGDDIFAIPPVDQ